MITRRWVCLAAVLAPTLARAQPADPKFSGWLAGLRAEALRAGVDHGTLDSAFVNIESLPRVLELAHNRPEFKMTFDEYLAVVVSPERAVGRGGRGRPAGREGWAYRPAGRGERTGLPHHREFPRHPALEPVGLFRTGGGNIIGPDCRRLTSQNYREN